MRFVYSTFGLALLAVLFLNNSSGAGNVQGIDRTGSPVATGFCNACHSSGAFNPTVEARLLDADGNVVTSYLPGLSYQLEVTINTQTMPQEYGFQAVALRAGNAGAGDFTVPSGMGLRTTNINSREYVEHSSPRTTNTFVVNWTAPAPGTGEVRFYAAGVAANNNSGSGGDGAARLLSPLTVTEAPISNANEPLALATDLRVFPNPTTDVLHVRLEQPATVLAQTRLYDAAGRTWLSQTQPLLPGQTTWTISLATLPAGLYWLELTDGNRAASRVAISKQ